MSDFPDLIKNEVQVLRVLRSNINKPEWTVREIMEVLYPQTRSKKISSEAFSSGRHILGLGEVVSNLQSLVKKGYASFREMEKEEARQRQESERPLGFKPCFYWASELGKKIEFLDTEKENTPGLFGKLVPQGSKSR